MKDFVFDLAKNDLSVSMKKLIDPLSMAFPSYAGEDWLTTLRQAKESDRSNSFINEVIDKARNDKSAIFDLMLSKFIEHLNQLDRQEWHGLVITSLTLEYYSKLLGPFTWTDKISPIITKMGITSSDGDPIALIEDLMKHYFAAGSTQGTQNNRVDSLAFWYVVRATELNIDIKDCLSSSTDAIRNYYDLYLNKRDDENEGFLKTLEKNKFLQYLNQRTRQNSPLSGNGKFDAVLSREAIYYFDRLSEDTSGDLVRESNNIVILGKSKSGKTTFVKQLKHASDYGNSVEPNFTLNPYNYQDDEPSGEKEYWAPDKELPDQTIKEIVALQGDFQSFGQKSNLYVFDHNGDIFEDKRLTDRREAEENLNVLERLCSSCDQLILALPPSLMSDDIKREELLSKMFGYVQLAISKNKNVVISIVYTMCDNYGCIIEGPRRVVHDLDSSNLFFKFKLSEGDDKEAAWDKFVNNLVVTTDAKDSAWAEQKRDLLNKSKELWRKIAHQSGENHRNINGYFVSALYPGQYENRKEFSKRGVLEVISDFLQYMSPPKFIKINKQDFVITNKSGLPQQLEVSVTNNGPYMVEYHLLVSDDDHNLLHRSTNDFSYYKKAKSQVGKPPPFRQIESIQVEINRETGLPFKHEFTFKTNKFKLGKNQYFQVVGVDKFGHICFSDIIEAFFAKRSSNLFDWWKSW